MQTIVSQVASRLGCTHCTLFVQEEQQGEPCLVPQVTAGPAADEVRSGCFRADEDLAGWVLEHGEPLLLQDAMGDPRLSFAWEDRGKPRSMLAVPVRAGREVVGVISAE
ncbi:MAG: GAF domain-containing protein, partial [bacterium]|nr:GAF domain-containing protein [bacterium]